jgi:alpha-1,2-mannosyltransferase
VRAVAEAIPLGRSRTLSIAALVAVATVILVSGLLTATSLDLYGWDFRVQYRSAAQRIVEGEPPYLPAEELAGEDLPYVYPPLVAWAAVPLVALPEDAAVVVAVLASIAAVFAALAIAGVRDVRCYLAVLASAPLWNIVETANISAVLALGLALAWRVRTTVWPAAAVLGLVVAAKLLLWPVLVWSAAMRRARTAALAVVVGMALTLVTWAAVGFQGFTAYPETLRELSDTWAEESYSLVGMAAALGLEAWLGRAATLVGGGTLIAACIVFGRRADDRRAFTCAIAAALALTPIAWIHYVVLLLVPLALVRPRFSWPWLLPMVLWVSPRYGNGDTVEALVPALVVVVLLVVMLARPRAAVAVPEAA